MTRFCEALKDLKRCHVVQSLWNCEKYIGNEHLWIYSSWGADLGSAPIGRSPGSARMPQAHDLSGLPVWPQTLARALLGALGEPRRP